ncbi:ATP-binding cassette domain-containing protein [Aeromicrobium fastidiosum]|uniref:UvrABC system protein A n=1 Tax=Aeromicrobium fastidiosum TaxID=52699 RepID=A0A641AKX2_9ACTN|nr:excinuclease ABC subunit UvrA [Aeromicrobium fastidiosum]KAA1376330.1 excinuclease ABC subunit UvrA [Aeromicrobium fastidiosum]MBP2391770.1 excinuclease ABC subunit A [Aeromicrobium fastidiosum]
MPEPTLPPQSSGWIRVRGAREHNLRQVDVDLPRDCFVVFTGVSGSGKSSLAFGTVFAESQRRYLESVAPYARRLMSQVGAPEVDSIDGMPPAVALQQARGATGTRSSLGTLSSLSDVLRLLFSRAGTYPDGADHLPASAFSPNTAVGACPTCGGTGVSRSTTEALLVPDPTLSIDDGAIGVWASRAWVGQNVRRMVTKLGIDVHAPWHTLPQETRDWLLFTDEEPRMLLTGNKQGEASQYHGHWSSAEKYLMRNLARTQSATQREKLEAFRAEGPCPTCHGKRLSPAALAVTFAGRDIAQIAAMPLTDLGGLLEKGLAQQARGTDRHGAAASSAARSLVKDFGERVEAIIGLGLGYLSMDRSSTALSPGELQRVRLAGQLRSGLFGVLYVLDEPSAGLHPADSEALYAALRQLVARGNSLFVVEHDLSIALHADWVVDVGPSAGVMGGEIVYSGPPAGLADVTESTTAEFMFGHTPTPTLAATAPTSWTTLEHLTRHNVDDVTVDVPLGVMTAVTGVSGAGKTSLLTAITERLEQDRRVTVIDQRPIGRSPRSNLATYTGLFDGVRRLFAATPEAKDRGWGAGRFSFNVAEGRCPTCDGEGFIAIELVFLPTSYSSCPTCHGSRYNPETLDVHYRGRDIGQVLAMTAVEAADFFADVPAIHRSLTTLLDVGLGYLTLGQPATELSGGEAQRIKLATELQRPRRDQGVIVLDEPTGGLHPVNVRDLVRVLRRLADAGDTVITVEHDMQVIAASDWVIELGPGGGDQGGRIVAAATPADLLDHPDSVTGPYLRRAMDGPTRSPAFSPRTP